MSEPSQATDGSASDEPAASGTQLPGARVVSPRPSGWRRLVTYLGSYVGTPAWRIIDEESHLDKQKRGFDWRILVVLLTCAVSLTLQEYLGTQEVFHKWFPSPRTDYYWDLKGYAWWAGWRVGGYVLLPMLVILCMPGERIRDYNVSLRGFWRHLPLYLGMFALFTPVLIMVSHSESFSRTYPFYKLANRSVFDLVAWELMYAVQFLSLEFFFRGFLLQGVRRQLGVNALFIMIIPYCMIHYGKPLPETLGAIGAGLLLGTIAMRTRSIWGGVIIHVCVAVTMDLLSVFGACPPFGGRRGCSG